MASETAAARPSSISFVIFLAVRTSSRQGRPLGAEVPVEGLLERQDRLDAQVVEEALRPREDRGDLEGDVHRDEDVLLEDLREALAAVELALGRLVEVGAELGEGGELAVLGEVEAERAGRPSASRGSAPSRRRGRPRCRR